MSRLNSLTPQDKPEEEPAVLGERFEGVFSCMSCNEPVMEAFLIRRQQKLVWNCPQCKQVSEIPWTS